MAILEHGKLASGILVTFIRGADGRFDWLRADHLSVAARVDDSDAGTPEGGASDQ